MRNIEMYPYNKMNLFLSSIVVDEKNEIKNI